MIKTCATCKYGEPFPWVQSLQNRKTYVMFTCSCTEDYFVNMGACDSWEEREK